MTWVTGRRGEKLSVETHPGDSVGQQGHDASSIGNLCRGLLSAGYGKKLREVIVGSVCGAWDTTLRNSLCE